MKNVRKLVKLSIQILIDILSGKIVEFFLSKAKSIRLRLLISFLCSNALNLFGSN